MRLLVLDTETTGVDRTKYYVLEVAAALYDTFDKAVLWSFSSLVHVPKLVANPSEDHTGISASMVQAARDFPDPWEYLLQFVRIADAIVAHNAAFDRDRIGYDRLPASVPWVCSQRQIKYPVETKRRNLQELAEAHGITPVGAHRAFVDVMTVVKLLQQVDDLDTQLEPLVRVEHGLYRVVLDSNDRNPPRDAFKKWGFTYHHGRRAFEKRMAVVPEDQLEASDDRPFAIRRVDLPFERARPADPSIEASPALSIAPTAAAPAAPSVFRLQLRPR